MRKGAFAITIFVVKKYKGTDIASPANGLTLGEVTRVSSNIY